jgi:hypothetical protein
LQLEVPPLMRFMFVFTKTPVFSGNLQMLFKSGERLLGTERALALAALGLVPAVAPWALDFLQLWRSRRAAPTHALHSRVHHCVKIVIKP